MSSLPNDIIRILVNERNCHDLLLVNKFCTNLVIPTLETKFTFDDAMKKDSIVMMKKLIRNKHTYTVFPINKDLIDYLSVPTLRFLYKNSDHLYLFGAHVAMIRRIAILGGIELLFTILREKKWYNDLSNAVRTILSTRNDRVAMPVFKAYSHKLHHKIAPYTYEQFQSMLEIDNYFYCHPHKYTGVLDNASENPVLLEKLLKWRDKDGMSIPVVKLAYSDECIQVIQRERPKFNVNVLKYK